jgi:glycosyltransferase involved in cell wall biosynthesis
MERNEGLIDSSGLDSGGIGISVVICCYNAEATLAETLASLCDQKWAGSWEILLSNNGSSDRSVEIFLDVAARHPEMAMTLVDASAKRGTPYARNTGVRKARGSKILFCDADDLVGTGWLSAMADALERHDFVAARFDLKRLNVEWISDVRRNRQEFELPRASYAPYLYHAGGGTFGFHKRVFERVGGFDESLLNLEDTDFCFRAQLAGFDLHYVPEAVVHVRARSDLRGFYRQAFGQAKYSLILSKRYKEYGPPNPRRWRRFMRRWVQVSRYAVRANHDDASKARAGRALGWAMGLLAGIVQERYPPP